MKITSEMKICIRCNHKCDGEIHIFRGGEYTRRLTELQTGKPVSLCAFGIPDDEFDTWIYDEKTNTLVGHRDPNTTFTAMEKYAKDIFEKLENLKMQCINDSPKDLQIL